ncbi:MAG: hypothetical protein QNJ15_09180 [Erythrobacter sp.]|nr:hypothetical protein [Erythrobacter sp.]
MPEIAIIFSSIIVMLIIIGISVNSIVAKVLEHKRSLRSGNPGLPDAQTNELSARTDMIEDRLRVLERIATDRGQLLSDEIEQLRIDTKTEEPQE